jgi:hypothetical protein
MKQAKARQTAANQSVRQSGSAIREARQTKIFTMILTMPNVNWSEMPSTTVLKNSMI